MEKYRLEILGVSETKMKGNGSKAVGKGRCIFAGIEEERAKAGVAKYVGAGESVSERVEVCKRKDCEDKAED